MKQVLVAAVCFFAANLSPQLAHAVSSAELYTATAYSYGRVETRLRFAVGDGVVSSFFLWKDGSEQAGMFWNELDFEKLGADCRLETNPIYGKPSANHSQRHTLALDLCGAFHDYVYEWTPEAIVWRMDGQEIRRETGATAQAFAENAGQTGMQIHLNLWPGDASFGGTFNPARLPVHQYVDWVLFSDYQNGELTLAWREEFDGVWACASLLHLPSPQLKMALNLIVGVLGRGGVLYVSLKEGHFEGVRDERWFTDSTAAGLRRLLADTKTLDVIRLWETADARPGATTTWVNALAKQSRSSV